MLRRPKLRQLRVVRDRNPSIRGLFHSYDLKHHEEGLLGAGVPVAKTVGSYSDIPVSTYQAPRSGRVMWRARASPGRVTGEHQQCGGISGLERLRAQSFHKTMG